MVRTTKRLVRLVFVSVMSLLLWPALAILAALRRVHRHPAVSTTSTSSERFVWVPTHGTPLCYPSSLLSPLTSVAGAPVTCFPLPSRKAGPGGAQQPANSPVNA
ncbi:hypothetical protein CC78DRAFT_577060 [Lojkania enalia]|uniref:Uncharacterized protein n=1 Tax=Lojkania enalia TaxID=147567 RepID=A0A9P4KFJ0_9PLEO|nr:hypothetical protein CC78DRAFT_577060 [Didymosphaeria enalia]